MKIHSKKLGVTLTFSQPANFYIFVDTNGKAGSRGEQICKGGLLDSGSALGCERGDYEEFRKICLAWYRAYLKNQAI